MTSSTHVLLQTLSTHGKGGVGGNARGVKQYNGELFAAVNNGSNTVADLQARRQRPQVRQAGDDDQRAGERRLRQRSHVRRRRDDGRFIRRASEQRGMDGWHDRRSNWLGAARRRSGSTAQVGVINERRLLVTLKTDPDPGTVDVVPLHDGAVTGAAPVAVSPRRPARSRRSAFPSIRDGTAVITLAHSNQDGLFRNGAFTSVIDAGQGAAAGRPSWKIRLHGQHRQQDHQSPDRHGEQRLRGQPGGGHHHDRRSAGGYRCRRRVSGRDRPRRRAVPLVVVHLQHGSVN